MAWKKHLGHRGKNEHEGGKWKRMGRKAVGLLQESQQNKDRKTAVRAWRHKLNSPSLPVMNSSWTTTLDNCCDPNPLHTAAMVP